MARKKTAARKKPAAKKKKKSARTIQFKLTYGGIAGIGVVVFCIFLWMFLLGIWAGQTLLLPSTAARKTAQARQAESGTSQSIHIRTLEATAKKAPALPKKRPDDQP